MTQRTREIGVRVASALRVQVVRLIAAGAAKPVLVGVVVGLLASSLLTDMLAGMLYGVRPLDPVSFVGGMAIFVAVTAVASFIPARRAASINPVDALRAE